MDLQQLRTNIDEIDDKMLALFKARMQNIKEIAQYKVENGLATLNAGREREILARVAQNSPEELENYVRTLFTTLFDLSRSYQTQLKNVRTPLVEEIEAAVENTPHLFPKKGIVACQGVEGAYSQIACDKLFSTANILYFRTFEGVFQAVEQGMCEFGILPIENSVHGTVNAVYDLMQHYHFHIVKSIKMKVDHVLLAKPGVALSQVKHIFSHEQAIGQCSAFLKGLKDVEITICENTAAAAKMVAELERTDVAAISSHNCAALYGLNILKDGFQNSDNNYTRFICISKDLRIYPGANRISLMLSAPHRPGSLYALISKFSALGVNLTKLESRPIPGKDFEFLFYFDLDASVYAADVLKLLGELSNGPEMFVFLGSYLEI